MQFEKYQHIERFGTVATDGILDGDIYIFDKLDGTNTGVYLNDNGEVEISSRNRVLTLDNDNAGACCYVLSNDKFNRYLRTHPTHRLFGEWLVKHSVTTYKDDAWRKLYIFDVIDTSANRYLTYEEYTPLLDEFNIDYIPLIAKLDHPNADDVIKLQDSCTFLQKDKRLGEGIVIKRYDFVNRFGKTVWAKIVRTVANILPKTCKPVNTDSIEFKIVNEFLTSHIINKERDKLSNGNGGWQTKLIPALLSNVWYTLISEEIFNVVKKYHNPTVDFKLLQKLVTAKIKEHILK